MSALHATNEAQQDLGIVRKEIAASAFVIKTLEELKLTAAHDAEANPEIIKKITIDDREFNLKPTLQSDFEKWLKNVTREIDAIKRQEQQTLDKLCQYENDLKQRLSPINRAKDFICNQHPGLSTAAVATIVMWIFAYSLVSGEEDTTLEPKTLKEKLAALLSKHSKISLLTGISISALALTLGAYYDQATLDRRWNPGVHVIVTKR